MDINVCCSEIRHFRHIVHSSWLDEDIYFVTLIRTVSITQYCKKNGHRSLLLWADERQNFHSLGVQLSNGRLGVIWIIFDRAGSGTSKMVAFKSELKRISQLVDKIKTKSSRLNLCFRGPPISDGSD